jgi:cytochrome c oxidase cbb3-type subunit 2
MPSYSFLKETRLNFENPSAHLVANRRVGVPYSDEMIENASFDLMDQADPEADTDGLLERYPKAVLGDFDGDASRLSEMDALVSYLQMLGTLVDFSAYEPEKFER